MAIDLFELRAHTEGVDIDVLRLVPLTEAGGGSDWGLMHQNVSGLSHWLALEAEDKDDAVRIIESVGLMSLREEEPVGGQQDIIFLLQPGSAQTPDGTPA